MKVVGIIAEYNPFHFGHAYQIKKARELFCEDTAIIAVMSGCFVQRGEPAIASKWARTQAALNCGVDLVIELPFTYACASAERFAMGAVELLQATGIVTDLYFGSECIDLPFLSVLANILKEENPAYKDLLKSNLKEGASYAKARELALTAYLAGEGRTDLSDKCASILRMPNTILALEYLIALEKTNSSIKPSILLRSGAGYHDSCISSENASASAIRNTVTNVLSSGHSGVSAIAGQLSGAIPFESLSVLLSEWSNGIRPVLASDFVQESILAVRTNTMAHLDASAYMGDQVSHRLKNAVSGLRTSRKEDLPAAFAELAETKRYAGTRIIRALISLLCGQTADDLSFLSSPQYLRILGFTERGRYLLRLMRKTASLPQIDKASDFLEYARNEQLTRMAELDLLSTDIWGLKAGYTYGEEYERSVIRTKGRK